MGPILWDITPCNPLKLNRHFGGRCRLHPRDQKEANRETSTKQVASKSFLENTPHFHYKNQLMLFTKTIPVCFENQNIPANKQQKGSRVFIVK
jgi:hypothetical protein